ncbi:MAG: PD-(D/E)XK nuclease family protein [Nanoarchaeota archaeon]|nr:PD-(D/E)XK nuclease family protein [Nanoarchaeota archaeon]
MEKSKKEGEKVSFNLSPTSLNTYYQSPLLFYLTYIAKVPDDTPVPVCYGLSGNIIHACLEKYAKKELDMDEAIIHLATLWEKYNLHSHKDLKGEVLNQEEYLQALLSGISIIEKHTDHICEENINFSLLENEDFKIGVKGIIDLQTKQKVDNNKIIIDYKTSNNINIGKEFQRQATFYNYLLYKQKNFIPSKTIFHYLKLGIPKVYNINIEDIKAFEMELNEIASQILAFGKDISNYPIGNIYDTFNSKRQACLNEVSKRKFLNNQISLINLELDRF